MELKHLKEMVTNLPAEAQTRPILAGLVSLLEESLSSEVASLRQELDTLKSAPQHGAICSDPACLPCTNARTAIAQQTKETIIRAFEDAANAFDLKSELYTLADAVQQHRAGKQPQPAPEPVPEGIRVG